jgi:hypothetical protein
MAAAPVAITAIDHAKIAAAKLIVAAGRAAGDALAGGVAVNAAATRAAAVVALNPPMPAAIGGAAIISLGGGAAAVAAVAADIILAAFVGAPGAIAVPPAVPPAALGTQASNLWDHCIERAHFWKIPASMIGVPAAPGLPFPADLNYVVWSAGARVGAGAIGLNSSFIVPPAAGFAGHFLAVLTGAATTSNTAIGVGPTTLCDVSWNGTLNGYAPGAAPINVAGGWVVNVHVHVGAPAAPAVVAPGTMMKCNLGVLVGAGQIQLLGGANNETKLTLEVVGALLRPAGAVVGAAGGAAIRGLVGAALPGGTFPAVPAVAMAAPAAPANAAAGAGVNTVTIGVNAANNVATMFPE